MTITHQEIYDLHRIATEEYDQAIQIEKQARQQVKAAKYRLDQITNKLFIIRLKASGYNPYLCLTVQEGIHDGDSPGMRTTYYYIDKEILWLNPTEMTKQQHKYSCVILLDSENIKTKRGLIYLNPRATFTSKKLAKILALPKVE